MASTFRTSSANHYQSFKVHKNYPPPPPCCTSFGGQNKKPVYLPCFLIASQISSKGFLSPGTLYWVTDWSKG